MTSTPTVAVVGAGPAALAAARRLRAEAKVKVLVVAPDGVSDYLGGSLPVATGDADVSQFRVQVELDGVEVLPAAAEAVGTGFVRVEGAELSVDAVIAAPGLATEALGLPKAGSDLAMVSFWDLAGAAMAAPVISGFERGVLSVVIATPLYRCPPAPYGLAIRLARRAKRLGLDVRVRLSTPEPKPLAAVGTAVTELLVNSCEEAGVELCFDVLPEPDALAAGHVVDARGAALPADLWVVVPPHRAHPLLADLSGPNHLVTADGWGRTAAEGVYVAGDALFSPFPRAVAPAAASGTAAAEGALVDLGLIDEVQPIVAEPDCFVDQGDGNYSRIHISYPSGPPPVGAPRVTLSPPASARSIGFDDAVARWRNQALSPDRDCLA